MRDLNEFDVPALKSPEYSDDTEDIRTMLRARVEAERVRGIPLARRNWAEELSQAIAKYVLTLQEAETAWMAVELGDGTNDQADLAIEVHKAAEANMIELCKAYRKRRQ